MAGIATFSFKPSPASCSGTLNSSKQVSRVSLRVRFPRRPLHGGRSLAAAGVGVVARYGGGYGGRRYQREPRVPDSDYDAALDLDKLKSSSVRLLDEQQNMIGVVSIDEAMQKADDGDLILAILSPDADPPVLRLFDSNDYKKHKYEQQKKKRVQQKRSAANRQDIKELKMGYNIDSHDYSVRLKAAQRFLKDGDKVKIIVNLKGRENEFRNIAIELLKRFQSDVGELASEESKNFNERNVFMVLMPNKVALQKSQEQPKKKETQATEVS